MRDSKEKVATETKVKLCGTGKGRRVTSRAKAKSNVEPKLRIEKQANTLFETLLVRRNKHEAHSKNANAKKAL